MPTSAPTQPRQPQIAVILLIAANCAIEAVLQASDFRLIGSPYWRSWIYDYFAFYAPLLRDWTPNFALQPVTMFVTYAFLHAGWLHLLVNMLALSSFGTEIARQAGARRFLLAYVLTAIGGAACYGALSASPTPMVGASGALFGLLGIWICWGYQERRHYGEGMKEIWRALFILVAYNVVFYLLLHGQLAWETHLGGFVSGWLLALFWGRPIYRRQRRA